MVSSTETRLWITLSVGARLARDKADTFVGMYVNDWTLDFGDRGREAVRLLLRRGYEAGVIERLVEPEFVDSMHPRA